ncbi:MAG: DUF547 domain-containing protein [Xanthomonadales bacterium]|nr:DUF547 domain-containing protein [Xanthomonadales bacterium]
MSNLIKSLLTIFLAVLISACQSTPKRPLVDAPTGAEIVTADQYSNQPFIELLQRFRNAEGALDYDAWSESNADLLALEQQVRLLAKISPDSHPEQFADRAAVRSYWVNTYNTLVIHAVLEYWPLDSVRDVKVSFSSHIIPGKGFFYDRPVVVGGEKTNLYDLEKKILRTQKDPRLHFALNCASSSCPVLQPWEWTDEQLEQAASDFINSPANVAVREMAVYLSKIFKWYKKDFGDDIHTYLLQYAQAPLKADLQQAQQAKFPVKYVDYDWDLNAQDNSHN